MVAINGRLLATSTVHKKNNSLQKASVFARYRKTVVAILDCRATIGNREGFSHDRCNIFPGLSYNKANNTFLNSLGKSEIEAQLLRCIVTSGAGTRDEPLRTSAWEADSLRCERLLVARGCESFDAELKSGISGINGGVAPGTRFDLIYAEGVCCRRHYHKVSQIKKP